MPIKSGVLTPKEPAIDLVRIISEGTYTSFPQALKEFISNSYDADSGRVDIRIDEDFNTIIIKDNGVGMTLADFRDYFASIGRPGKSGSRSIRGRTALGRQKIGRFGIGSLAIVGTAERFTIAPAGKTQERGLKLQLILKNSGSIFIRELTLADTGYLTLSSGQANHQPTTLQRSGLKDLILKSGQYYKTLARRLATNF